MESKNIYIVLAVVVVAFIGFMGYRHFSKADEMKAHHEDTYKRLTEMAKQNPRMGMPDMGRALKRYYAANNSYPESLDALYPDYITGRSFIDEIKWDYRPGDNDFFLSKSVERGGKILTASMDSTLKTRVGTGTMVAAKTPSEGTLKLPAGMDLLSALRVPDFKLDEGEKEEEIRPVRVEPRTVAVDEEITPSVFAASVSRSYLVWRDENGNIGFGNIQYPHVNRISIASRDRWLRIERRPLEDKAPEVEQEPAGRLLSASFKGEYLAWQDGHGTIGFGNVQYPEKKSLLLYADRKWVPVTAAPTGQEVEGSVEEGGAVVDEEVTPSGIAASVIRSNLVWRDAKGNIGFGNVQYPNADQISIAARDGWLHVEGRLVGDRTSDTPDPSILKQEPAGAVAVDEEVTPPAFAVSESRSSLVWRDAKGNIGFGNIQYPNADRISIATRDRWMPVERGPVGDSAPETPNPSSAEQEPGSGLLSASLEGPHLAWRDGHGIIGFGNVQYPEKKSLLLYADRMWVPATSAPIPTVRKVEAAAEEGVMDIKRKEDPDQTAKRFGGQYLAWKDKNGDIGFGNVQYPIPGDAVYIYVNGRWEAFEKSNPL